MKTFFLAFDFKDLEDLVMVKYQAEKDLRDRILSDLITLVSTRTSKADKMDIDKVLESLGVEWILLIIQLLPLDRRIAYYSI